METQVSDALAHTHIENACEAPVCVHATKSSLLDRNPGNWLPGLIPGGLRLCGSQQDYLAHIHCGAARPDGETVFAGFRRQGVDVQIELDVGALIRQGHTLFRSS